MLFPPCVVVPLVGTWIETDRLAHFNPYTSVVPLVGTWIETGEDCRQGSDPARVVPLVGTWIETLLRHSKGTLAGGRSPRGNVD